MQLPQFLEISESLYYRPHIILAANITFYHTLLPSTLVMPTLTRMTLLEAALPLDLVVVITSEVNEVGPQSLEHVWDGTHPHAIGHAHDTREEGGPVGQTTHEQVNLRSRNSRTWLNVRAENHKGRRYISADR